MLGEYKFWKKSVKVGRTLEITYQIICVTNLISTSLASMKEGDIWELELSESN